MRLTVLCVPTAFMRPLLVFFFNDTATTEIYTLSLHDALPIWSPDGRFNGSWGPAIAVRPVRRKPSSGRAWPEIAGDRKSTRLNSSHQIISYAVFCLKKKTTIDPIAHF